MRLLEIEVENFGLFQGRASVSATAGSIWSAARTRPARAPCCNSCANFSSGSQFATLMPSASTRVKWRPRHWRK